MNILIATNHLVLTGGTETWTYTMAKAFKKLYHYVEVTALSMGPYAKEMKEHGVNIVEKPKDEYHLIILNHNTVLKKLSNVKGYRIFTSHGTIPGLEQPEDGADQYVAISEEVRDHMKELGYDAHIIRNPVDLDEFKSTREIEGIKKCLIVTDTKEGFLIASTACSDVKLDYVTHGKMNPVFSLAEKMNESDIVISLGRGCYEAMACGRPVVIFDYRQYIGKPLGDGLIDRNIEELMKYNCSGRAKNLEMTAGDVAKELRKADKWQGKDNRRYAEEHFDSKKIAKQYIDLWKQETN